jgi:hypothetical protein
MLFGYPVASCCGIPTRKLRIILMQFLVMCVFSWVFLAALIMGSICGVEVLMCVLQALSVIFLFENLLFSFRFAVVMRIQ